MLLSKNSPVQSGILSVFVLIQLYRPILIAHNKIILVYTMFFLAFLILIAQYSILKQTKNKDIFLLSLYVFFPTFASLLSKQDVPIDQLGLLLFLPISYILGIWLGTKGSTHFFFRVMAAIFLVIAVYILKQLINSNFSYHTYYYWSAAAYKIDYLTSSSYAVILLIYFFFNGKNILEKYGISLFCLAFIAMSGARYSILFVALSSFYVFFKSVKQSPLKLLAGLLTGLFIIMTALLFNNSLMEKTSDLVSYSLFRIENLADHDTSVAGRLELIQKAGTVISNNFFFGVGVGGSGEALQSNYPHNMLLEAFIDGGFFSFIALFIFIAICIKSITKSVDSNKTWVMMLVLYLLGAYLKSFSIYESRVLFFFLGYAVKLRLSDKVNDSKGI